MQIHTLKLNLIFLNPKRWAAWKADAHLPTGNHHFLLYSSSTDLMKKTYTGLWLLLLRFKIKIYEQVTVESRCGQLEQTTNTWEQIWLLKERCIWQGYSSECDKGPSIRCPTLVKLQVKRSYEPIMD